MDACDTPGSPRLFARFAREDIAGRNGQDWPHDPPTDDHHQPLVHHYNPQFRLLLMPREILADRPLGEQAAEGCGCGERTSGSVLSEQATDCLGFTLLSWTQTHEAQKECGAAGDGPRPMQITPADEKRAQFRPGHVTTLHQCVVYRLNDE